MSTAADILAGLAEQQGWTQSTQLDLVLAYIDNQQDNDLFAEVLTEIAASEDAGDPDLSNSSS